MSILYFLLAINFAVIPQGGVDLYNNHYILSPTEDYKIGFIAEIVLLNTVFVGGECNIYMNPDYHSFEPKILDSQFYIKVDFEWINFQFLHRCTHPIVCWANASVFRRNYESYYRELKIEFVNKFNIIK